MAQTLIHSHALASDTPTGFIIVDAGYLTARPGEGCAVRVLAYSAPSGPSVSELSAIITDFASQLGHNLQGVLDVT